MGNEQILAEEYLKVQNGKVYEDEEIREICRHAYMNGYLRGEAFSYRKTYYEYLDIRRREEANESYMSLQKTVEKWCMIGAAFLLGCLF